jgi:hypothetical protein
MSWIDSLSDFAGQAGRLIKTGFDWFSSGSIGSSIAKTALIGYAANRVNKSINKSNDVDRSQTPAPVDPGVRVQVNPDASYKVPVLYGTATWGGTITDAWLTSDNKTMYFCLTLAERTGTLLSTAASTSYVFNDVYANDNRIIFKADGITADYMIDRDGNRDPSIRDLFKVYCYAGNSELPVIPEYYTASVPGYAYNIMPNWTSDHMMEDLIFAIIEIDYSKDKGVTGIPRMQFTITSSMSLPGDVLYDYMTNTRYGAGIPATDILAS